jgi:ABC-type uncharacterized transport system involved in gliding motility auxiliary subunit
MAQNKLKNTPQRRERVLLVLVLGVFAAAVVNLSVFGLRFDLTSSGAYSISDATKAVFAQAKDEVTITYFLSKKLADQVPDVQGVSDFLEEYAAASGGRVKVKTVDPKESGQLNDMARMGLQPFTLNIVEQSQQTQVVTYSGILLQYQNRQEVLPLVGNVQSLEYDLTTKVTKLVTQKQKTIALLTADPALTMESSFRYLSQVLTKTATFRQVQPGEPIGDASVLIVVGAKGFTPETVKPIDDYLQKGGKVLFAVDGVFVDLNSAQAVPQAAGSNALLSALETWGVKVDQSLALDVYVNTLTFNSPQGPTRYQYPLWPQILPANTSKTNPITSRFSGLSLLWPSPLTDLKKPGLTAEVLVTTSEKSWAMKDNFTIDPQAAVQSRQYPNVKFGKQDEVLAVSGSFPSASGAPGASPATRILVVGSSAAVTDTMQFISTDGGQGNLDFVDASVDWLSQDEGLLKIKTRAYRDKSLTVLQDEGVRAATSFALSFVTLLVVPLALVIWAVVRFLRRRAREHKLN